MKTCGKFINWKCCYGKTKHTHWHVSAIAQPTTSYIVAHGDTGDDNCCTIWPKVWTLNKVMATLASLVGWHWHASRIQIEHQNVIKTCWQNNFPTAKREMPQNEPHMWEGRESERRGVLPKNKWPTGCGKGRKITTEPACTMAQRKRKQEFNMFSHFSFSCAIYYLFIFWPKNTKNSAWVVACRWIYSLLFYFFFAKWIKWKGKACQKEKQLQCRVSCLVSRVAAA